MKKRIEQYIKEELGEYNYLWKKISQHNKDFITQ